MRLISVHIIKADTCGGLLDGLNLSFRNPESLQLPFEPFCLIGPNGTGKSQLLQVLAEIFQSVFHATVRNEERLEGNPTLEFEVEYVIQPPRARSHIHIRIARKARSKNKAALVIQRRDRQNNWVNCDLTAPHTIALLPRKIVGYTSGDNETLSLPFLISRSGYADEVGRRALDRTTEGGEIPDTRLMLIDYGTHLEVLVANLLLGSRVQRSALLKDARLSGLHSLRCIIQLAHSAAPKVPARLKATSKRKGIQLTSELEGYLDQLQRCATCHHYQEKTETYTFDFLVDSQTEIAFSSFWESAVDLYSSLHKFAMLNDLAIPKTTRERFKKNTKARRFASRLPEPQDEDKVFRFERVNFRAQTGNEIVDYVSLSDGEHQLAQLLGTFCMLSFPDVLFLLDEPESHFNPQWRIEFISKLLDLPTRDGKRRSQSRASRQDGLLTTHAPFVPSDMTRDKVLIFGRNNGVPRIKIRRPANLGRTTKDDQETDEQPRSEEN
jgi:restriction system-associated AAA family ATPase